MCPQLTYIGVLATGYNVVDLAAAKEQGIIVTNIPSYSTNAVAQATFALLLEVTNQVGHHNRSVHQGDWQTSKDFSYWQTPLMELAGKTIGLIGYGAIAQAVATIAHAFQLKPSAILINTARGGLIDEAAVAEALQNGQIAALAADVVSKEPIAADNPLLQAPNCYLTPHIAWAPVETRRRLMGIAVANLSGFKAGTPQNVV